MQFNFSVIKVGASSWFLGLSSVSLLSGTTVPFLTSFTVCLLRLYRFFFGLANPRTQINSLVSYVVLIVLSFK